MWPSGLSNGLPRGPALVGLSSWFPFRGPRHKHQTPLSFASFKAHNTLAFLCSPDFLLFHRLVQVLVVTVHGFPRWSFDSLEYGLAEGVPVLVNKRRLPSFTSHIRSVGEGAQNTFCFLPANSEVIRAFPNNSSREICRELWLCHSLGPCFFLHIPNLHCRKIVDCNKQPELAHHCAQTFSPASLVRSSYLKCRHLSVGQPKA